MAERKIFISYSRVDGQQFAVELSARLRKAGANVWLDQVDIEPGKIWDFEIEKALQTSEAVIFIATEKSTSSNNVLNEVYYALEENKEVIPVIFHDCKMPFRLKRLQYIDFTNNYETALARLLKALHLQPDDGILPVKENIEKQPEKRVIIEQETPPVTRQHEIKRQPEMVARQEYIAAPPVNRTIPPAKKNNNTLFWVIAGVGLLLMVLAGLYSGNSSTDKKDVYRSPANNGSDTQAGKEDPVTQKPIAGNKPKLNSNWRTFTQANYGIQYPPNWDLNQNPGLGTSFVLFSRFENASDVFRENISLVIQNLSGRNVDLDKFATASEEQVKTMVMNGVLLESKRVEDGQYPHHRILYTSDQNPYHLTTEQYYWVFNDQAYVLTLSCEQDKFSMYQQVGEQILNSFYFK